MPDSIQPDPVLSQQSYTIEQRVGEAARSLTIDELDALLGVVGREMVSVTNLALEATSASIWLTDEERTKMVVSHSEPVSDIIGREQPIDEGFVSLVFASEQAICENQVYEQAQHSKRIDAELGQVTCSMIATPFYLAGQLRGVLSCVKLKDSTDAPDPPPFTAANLNRVKRLATALERMLNFRILTRVLDLEL